MHDVVVINLKYYLFKEKYNYDIRWITLDLIKEVEACLISVKECKYAMLTKYQGTNGATGSDKYINLTKCQQYYVVINLLQIIRHSILEKMFSNIPAVWRNNKHALWISCLYSPKHNCTSDIKNFTQKEKKYQTVKSIVLLSRTLL